MKNVCSILFLLFSLTAVSQQNKKVYVIDDTIPLGNLAVIDSILPAQLRGLDSITGYVTPSGLDSLRKATYSGTLPNWMNKLIKTPGEAKMVFVGNSTSSFTGNASSIKNLIYNQTLPGRMLAGFDTSAAHMPNFGKSRNTLQNFATDDTSSMGIKAVIDFKPDLIVFSYGINDVRQNQLTKDGLKNLVIQVVERFKKELPTTDIVLRMPNSFRIPQNDTFIQKGSYASLAEAAQAQSDILYTAYKELEYRWQHVVLLNTQDLIFGRKVKSPNLLMTDDIHPKYDPIIAELIKIIGYKEPYSEYAAQAAQDAAPAQPYTIYKRALENTKYYKPLAVGVMNGYSAGVYFDINIDNPYRLHGLLQPGDIVSLADSVIFKIAVNAGLGVQGGAIYRILANDIPAIPLPIKSPVVIYRSLTNNSGNTNTFIDNKLGYPYRRKVLLGTCGNGFIRINSVVRDSEMIMTYNLTPADFRLDPADVLIAEGTNALTLTGATFTIPTNTSLQINIGGDYTSYSQKIAYLFGNHAQEGYAGSLVVGKTGTTLPATSAIVDIRSNTQGFLPPRMTTTERTAIANKAEGLCVYDTSLHKLYVWDGTVWQAAW